MRIFSTVKQTQEEILARKMSESVDVSATVSEIVTKVKTGGDQAIKQLTKEIDGVELADLRVVAADIEASVNEISSELLAVLKKPKKILRLTTKSRFARDLSQPRNKELSWDNVYYP